MPRSARPECSTIMLWVSVAPPVPKESPGCQGGTRYREQRVGSRRRCRCGRWERGRPQLGAGGLRPLAPGQVAGHGPRLRVGPRILRPLGRAGRPRLPGGRAPYRAAPLPRLPRHPPLRPRLDRPQGGRPARLLLVVPAPRDRGRRPRPAAVCPPHGEPPAPRAVPQRARGPARQPGRPAGGRRRGGRRGAARHRRLGAPLRGRPARGRALRPRPERRRPGRPHGDGPGQGEQGAPAARSTTAAPRRWPAGWRSGARCSPRPRAPSRRSS